MFTHPVANHTQPHLTSLSVSTLLYLPGHGGPRVPVQKTSIYVTLFEAGIIYSVIYLNLFFLNIAESKTNHTQDIQVHTVLKSD